MPIERLGHASFPSGRAVLVDVALLGGELAQDWEAWAAVVEDVATGTYEVHGERDTGGPHPDRWKNVWVEFASGNVASSDFAGVIPVESARLLFIDAAAIAKWDLDKSRDGKADLVFRGRDAASLAKLLEAPAISDGAFGFVDRPTEEIAAIASDARGLLAGRGWNVTTGQHPHTDVHLLVRAASASATASADLELAGATMCMFFDPWGNGVHKVLVDRDADGRPLRFRVELATDADATDDTSEVEAGGDSDGARA